MWFEAPLLFENLGQDRSSASGLAGVFVRAYSSVGESARLISVRSVVRIYLGPPLMGIDFTWGCSSAGRAAALQAVGRRFDSAQLHHFRDGARR